ncbi:carbohydrate porin [Asaia siamensis]|uniref:Porin n=1 Tax=Asaia siamensis TaxID=110479 RepID=A0ABQ1L9M1_9PROT|nr:carbohydrate porin [Asaia siamensis]GGC20053.1 porin [Asaia siamensis]
MTCHARIELKMFWLILLAVALTTPSAVAGKMLTGLPALREKGVAFHVQNTNEMQAMLNDPAPSHEKGVGNVGIVTYGSDIDWERLAGLSGVSTHIVLASGYGTPTSRKFGDHLTPSQATYGGVGNVVIHLVSAYIERSMFYDHLNAAVGRMTFLSDFSANPLYCNFMNAAFCGNPRAASDNTAHAAFPTATWGARFRVQISEALQLQSGVYFTQAASQYALSQMRSGFKFNGATIDGEAIPLELAWEPHMGRGGTLPGHYKLGAVYDTAPHSSLFEDHDGEVLGLTGAPARVVNGSWSAWVLADQQLLHFAGRGPDAGLTILASAYWNNPRTALRAAQYSVGFMVRGLIRQRPQDMIAINLAYTRIAHHVTHAQRLRAALQKPGDGSPFPVQREALIIEALYQIHLIRGITVAPDLQYYIHPNAQHDLRNQWMLGVKTQIEFI